MAGTNVIRDGNVCGIYRCIPASPDKFNSPGVIKMLPMRVLIDPQIIDNKDAT
jgi:hypothetical protein